MLSIAPYHVSMFTATSADAGAMTVTSKLYRAGDGAVIRYCAEERPAGSTNRAACGCKAAAPVPVICLPWLCVPRPLPPPPVHPPPPTTNTPHAPIPPHPLLNPPP